MTVSTNAASQHRTVAVWNVVHDDCRWLQPVDRVAFRALLGGDHVFLGEERQHAPREVARVTQRKPERPGWPSQRSTLDYPLGFRARRTASLARRSGRSARSGRSGMPVARPDVHPR